MLEITFFKAMNSLPPVILIKKQLTKKSKI